MFSEMGGPESFEKPKPFKKGDLVQLTKRLGGVPMGEYEVGIPYVIVHIDPPSQTEPFIWIAPVDTPQEEMDSFDSAALTGEKGYSDKFMPCRPDELEPVIKGTLH